MKFKLAKISGVDDAIITLYVSKRKFDENKCIEIREQIRSSTLSDGSFAGLGTVKPTRDYLDMVCKYGLQLGYKRCHETILRFIDFSIETRGLHKAAMGDLDAHAQRMNNRIVRASSRLAGFTSGEKSDYYKGKIFTVGEVCNMVPTVGFANLGLDVPEEVVLAGDKFKFNGFGYVREDCWDDQDVQRGTYMLSIPSDSIWKCDYVGLKHIYAMRHQFTHAHPELTDGMEQLADQIEAALPILGMGIRHEWVGTGPNDGGWVHVDKVGFTAK